MVACSHRKKFSGLRIEDESNILAFHLQYLGFFAFSFLIRLFLRSAIFISLVLDE